jgi:hypothetical protein
MMSWSDAIRAESAFLESHAVPEPADDLYRFGTLGRALWRERSLAWILTLNPAVRKEDARKIIADLSAALQPLHAE